MPFCHVSLRATKLKFTEHSKVLITLGDHLRAKRLELNLLQKQVAQEIGVDEMTICNWETNRVKPALRFIPRIIQFLGYCPYIYTHSLSERLRVCREALGLSQKNMAKALGVDESTLAGWEIGKVRPTKKSQQIIKDF